MGIAMSGLTSDGRSLCRYMRSECLNHKYVYGSAIQTERLINDVADKHQRATWSYVRRPYGVGLLVAGYDVSGVCDFTDGVADRGGENLAAAACGVKAVQQRPHDTPVPPCSYPAHSSPAAHGAASVPDRAGWQLL